MKLSEPARQFAVKLHLAKYSELDIAKRLGVTEQQVRECLAEATAKKPAPPTETLDPLTDKVVDAVEALNELGAVMRAAVSHLAQRLTEPELRAAIEKMLSDRRPGESVAECVAVRLLTEFTVIPLHPPAPDETKNRLHANAPEDKPEAP